jgi:hypothetical protein
MTSIAPTDSMFKSSIDWCNLLLPKYRMDPDEWRGNEIDFSVPITLIEFVCLFEGANSDYGDPKPIYLNNPDVQKYMKLSYETQKLILKNLKMRLSTV